MEYSPTPSQSSKPMRGAMGTELQAKYQKLAQEYAKVTN